MKQSKKLTRRQKSILSRNGLSPDEWAVSWEGNNAMTVRNKKTGEYRLVEKK